jgi:dihydrofolate synthase/folylpolyglutamate synthase
MVNDKDISGVLALLPREAKYYFTQASVSRALPADQLYALATQAGLHGEAYPTVKSAVEAAMQHALPDDFIFVGGSNFIVADLLVASRLEKSLTRF